VPCRGHHNVNRVELVRLAMDLILIWARLCSPFQVPAARLGRIIIHDEIDPRPGHSTP
jgi:hypothetical protein